MTYRPDMTTSIEGFSVTQRAHRRFFDGMIADLWEVDCATHAGGRYSGRDPRLFVLLNARCRTDGTGSSDFTLSQPGGASVAHGPSPAVSFVPAGMVMESDLRGFRSLRHLDLHFDADMLRRRLGPDFDPEALEEPRLRRAEPRLLALAELLAGEFATATPLNDLYGESLTLALLLATLQVPPAERRRRTRLGGRQLRRVTDFIEENCLRPIRLEELARLTGLSESYFSHAFKAATGMPPHQWQTRARIARVKLQLEGSDLPLTAIAADTGFADAAHFSKVFRRETGMSPSAWRRARLNKG